MKKDPFQIQNLTLQKAGEQFSVLEFFYTFYFQEFITNL